MKKILIIDENTIYREGVKALFQTNASSYHVDDLKNYFQCFDFLSNRSNRPDYIILCCHDDNPELLKFISDLKKRRYKIKIVVLCNSKNSSFLCSLWNLNLDALLLSSCSFTNLLYVLENVSRETFSKYLDPLFIPLINSSNVINSFEQEIIDSLSKQELKILHLLSTGLSNQEIGLQLSVSERTVKNHLYSIYKKINCSDRTQASIFAIRNHI